MNLPEATVAAVIDAELTDVMHVKMLCMSFLCIKLCTCTGFPPGAQRFYRYLHEERHYSQMTLLVGLLAIPLTLGKTTVGVQHPHCTTLQFEVLKCIFHVYLLLT